MTENIPIIPEVLRVRVQVRDQQPVSNTQNVAFIRLHIHNIIYLVVVEKRERERENFRPKKKYISNDFTTLFGHKKKKTKFQIQNSKFKIENSKLRTRNSKLKIQNL